MPAFDVHPHSRRISGLAVAGLMLIAASSFTVGLTHQIAARAASAPLPQGQAGAQAYAAIPEATPAPEMQLAVAAPAPVVRRKAPPELTAVVEDIPQTAAETAPAIDAAAAAPDNTPAPLPAEPPPTP